MMKHRIILFAFAIFPSVIFAQEISLQQAITIALERNYGVRVAKTNFESAKTDNKYSVGAFVPQINATGSTVWNGTDQELRFEDASRNNEGRAESHNIAASANLSWMLFDGTRMFAARNRLDETQVQTELDLKQEMVNTIADVIQNYYDIVRQEQQLKAILDQMSVSEERVKLADRRLEVGVGAKPELLQAKVDYNAFRTAALNQEAAISMVKEQLNGLLDLQLPPNYDVADTIVIDLAIDRSIIETNVETANYGLQAARAGINATSYSIKERRGERYPFLFFNAAYNYSKLENTRIINPFGPVYSLSNGLNYGFTLNIPIVNNFLNRRNIQQARITLDRQLLLFSQQKNSISIELRNAYTVYEKAKEILLVEEENISLAKENVTIAFEIYKRGASTYVELRTAQQSLAEATTRLINARYAAKLAETDLLRVTGELLK
jgi:outer membrane protein